MSTLPPEQDPLETQAATPPAPSPYPRDMAMGNTVGMPTAEEKQQSMLMWILSIFFCPFAALIFFLIANDKPFLKRQSAQALTWGIVAVVLYIVLFITVVGILLIPLIGIANLVLCIMGAMATNKGENYNAPVIAGLSKSLFKM